MRKRKKGEERTARNVEENYIIMWINKNKWENKGEAEKWDDGDGIMR